MASRGKSDCELAALAAACIAMAFDEWLIDRDHDCAMMYLKAAREWRECLKMRLDGRN